MIADDDALNMSQLDHWPLILKMRTAEPPSGGDGAAWAGWLSDRYIPTHNGREFREQAEDTADSVRSTRRRWVGVDAPAGFGKSEVVSQWALKLPPAEPKSAEYVGHRLVWIEGDSSMKGAALLASIMRFLGFDVSSSSTESALRDDLTKLLPQLGTKFLVIDDAHMLRKGTTRVMADTCRTVLRLPVTTIFVGSDFEESALLGTASGEGAQASAQMRRRHDAARLTPLRAGDPKQERAFTDLVADFRQLFLTAPDSRAPALSDQRLVGDLHAACGGYPGPLFECLKRASRRALKRDRTLTADDIKAYWPRLDNAT